MISRSVRALYINAAILLLACSHQENAATDLNVAAARSWPPFGLMFSSELTAKAIAFKFHDESPLDAAAAWLNQPAADWAAQVSLTEIKPDAVYAFELPDKRRMIWKKVHVEEEVYVSALDRDILHFGVVPSVRYLENTLQLGTGIVMQAVPGLDGQDKWGNRVWDNVFAAALEQPSGWYIGYLDLFVGQQDHKGYNNWIVLADGRSASIDHGMINIYMGAYSSHWTHSLFDFAERPPESVIQSLRQIDTQEHRRLFKQHYRRYIESKGHSVSATELKEVECIFFRRVESILEHEGHLPSMYESQLITNACERC